MKNSCGLLVGVREIEFSSHLICFNAKDTDAGRPPLGVTIPC